MKIAILGSGAMGCLYGGFLAESGENQVTLIDIWKDHIEAINSRGLIIETPEGERVIKNLRGLVTATNADIMDLVIIFVKAIVTQEAMSQALNLIGPGAMVLTLQNGLGNVEKLCRLVEASQVVAGITSFGSFLNGPGRVQLRGRGETIIGELNGDRTERLENLKAVFDRSNLPTRITTNVIGGIWTKLIVNIGVNALATVLRCNNGRLLETAEAEQIVAALVDEAAQVARAKGILLETDDPLGHTKSVIRNTGQNICSMLQDVLAERPTEIKVLNAAIVAAGHELGIPTPVNQVFSNLVQIIQTTAH